MVSKSKRKDISLQEKTIPSNETVMVLYWANHSTNKPYIDNVFTLKCQVTIKLKIFKFNILSTCIHSNIEGLYSQEIKTNNDNNQLQKVRLRI